MGLLSDRLKSDYNFVKRLISAKYDEHDDATKYCFHAWRYLSKEEQVTLKKLGADITQRTAQTFCAQGRSRLAGYGPGAGELGIGAELRHAGGDAQAGPARLRKRLFQPQIDTQ